MPWHPPSSPTLNKERTALKKLLKKEEIIQLIRFLFAPIIARSPPALQLYCFKISYHDE